MVLNHYVLSCYITIYCCALKNKNIYFDVLTNITRCTRILTVTVNVSFK